MLHFKIPLIFLACIELHPLFGVFHMLHFKTPLISGACVELYLLFGNFEVLYCKTPIIFDACVELRLYLSMCMWCILQHLLYLALALNYIHCFVFSMCCISKYLLYLALLLNYVFNCQCGCAALQKTSYIWRLC